jgi:hypothetical protein
MGSSRALWREAAGAARQPCRRPPSSAHEEGRPSVLVELTAPEVDQKICETNPITSQESW